MIVRGAVFEADLGNVKKHIDFLFKHLHIFVVRSGTNSCKGLVKLYIYSKTFENHNMDGIARQMCKVWCK